MCLSHGTEAGLWPGVVSASSSFLSLRCSLFSSVMGMMNILGPLRGLVLPRAGPVQWDWVQCLQGSASGARFCSKRRLACSPLAIGPQIIFEWHLATLDRTFGDGWQVAPSNIMSEGSETISKSHGQSGLWTCSLCCGSSFPTHWPSQAC